MPQFFYLIHERIFREVDQRGTAAKWAFRAMLATSFRLRRIGVNLGPWLFGRVHALMGRQMRLFVTGGSKFDPAIGRDFYALGFTILQAYGLTETSGAAAITTPDEAHFDTVGRPLPGRRLKILPPEGAVGEAADGEIALRGPLVMQGYFNRPDATAAVMRDGWFLTGDLGRRGQPGAADDHRPEEGSHHPRQRQESLPRGDRGALPPIAVREGDLRHDLGAGRSPRASGSTRVVVPDMEALAARKIVNAGDLLRFELEGLSASLPSYKRVLGYEVWFEPLPRTTTGKLKRHEIVGESAEAGTAARPSTGARTGRRGWRTMRT